MSFDRPKIVDLRNRVLNSLEVVELPYSFRGLLANSLSGLSHMMHGHIDYMSRNMFPDTATGDILDHWASLWGLNRKPYPAWVMLDIKGNVGNAVPEIWEIGSIEFKLEKPEIISNEGNSNVKAIAQSTESIGSRPETATVKTSAPGIESDARITDFLDAIPPKTDREFQRQLRQVIRQIPQGGAPLDYIVWIESLEPVARAWVRPSRLTEIPGTVQVTFVEKSLGQKSLDEVRKLLKEVAPAHAIVEVVELRPVPNPVEFTVTPSDDLTKKHVKEAINKVFLENSAPMGYLDFALRKTSGCILRSEISQAISKVSGVESFTLAMPEYIEVKEGEIAAYEH